MERMDQTRSTDSTNIARALVVIPTYNESENIEWIVGRTRAAIPEIQVLIVDDGSPDGTGAIADAIASKDPRVSVMHRPAKAGLGTAYVEGFQWGISRHYDTLVEMDADGSHRPEDLPRLLHKLEEADLVLGSRWVSGGEVVNWSRRRSALSRSANWYARHALRIKIRDVTAGFRAYRRPVLEAIRLDTVTSQGYSFQIDLTRRVAERGLKIAEVPIRFEERERGESKMSGAIIAEAMKNVTRWGLLARRHGFSDTQREAQGD
jgi:dolichol-phosphate mannosyltransferase